MREDVGHAGTREGSKGGTVFGTGKRARPLESSEGVTPKSSEASENRPAPGSSNRGATISRGCVGAVDWLSFGVAVQHSRWETWKPLFQTAKEAAADGAESGGLVEIEPGLVLEIQPSGMGKGYGHARYVAYLDGIMIAFVDRAEAGKTPNVRVEVTGRVCLRLGYRAAVLKVGALLDALDAKIEGTTVSRIDLAVDSFAISVPEVLKAAQEDKVIRRSRKSSVEFGNGFDDPETVYLGDKSSSHLCIYDKIREAGKDPEYLQELQKLRWGGEPEVVTRFEFRLRRDELRERGISNLDDLENLPDLLAWLTVDHTRFTARAVQSNNYDDTPMADWWKEVASCCLQLGPLQDAALLPVPPQAGGELQKQAMGCVAAWIVQQGGAPTKKSEFLDWAIECLKDARKGLEKVKAKAVKRMLRGERGRTAVMEDFLQELRNGEGLLGPGSCYAWGNG